jgi:putative membrane protein
MPEVKKNFLRERPYAVAVIFVVALLWIWSGWHPAEYQNWLTENIPVIALTPLVIYFLFYIRLSNFSVTLLAIFLTLHFVGAHYNYGEVGFGRFLQAIFHASKDIYDRFVHFGFGLLVVYPIRELLLRVADVKGFWSYYLPFDIVLSFSALYEIFEWITVAHLPPNVGLLFIGGNDVMDAPKDMACAAVGAIISLTILGIFHAQAKNNFWVWFKQGFKLNRETILRQDSFLHRFFTHK